MPQEVRLGLALNGGVSLAIWIGGVADELLRAVSAGTGHAEAQDEWLELCRELDVSVKVDVIVGTSAGGINGAFLAAGLANDAANLVALQDLWINSGDFSQLMHPPRSAGMKSLLRGDSYFLPTLQNTLEAVAATGTGPRPLDPPLDVRLTSTDLQGRVVKISDGETLLHSVDHAVEFRFAEEDFHFATNPAGSAQVARACRSTASFPGAFEASTIPAGLFEPRHAPALTVDGAVAPAWLVDGGVLNNLPARNAVEAIAAQPAGERVHRVLALVVPDPVVPVAEEGLEPLLTRTVGQSTVSIPRNQSMSSFLGEVRDLNQDVLSRRAARTAFLGELGELSAPEAWQRFAAVSAALFPAYRAAVHRRSCDQVLARLSNRLSPDLAALLVRVAGDAESVVLPWVPDALDDSPEDSWGGAPVRRLVALLVTATDLAAGLLRQRGDDAAAMELLGRKKELTAIRADADTYAPVDTFDTLLLEEMGRHPSDPEAALRSALSRWAAQDEVSELYGLVGRLGDHLQHVADTMRPHLSDARDEANRSMSGLVRLCDGAGEAGIRRLLVGFEVVEMAFGPAAPPPDQVVRLAHFTADEGVAMDPLRRDDPEEKLAGVQLGHFAAFLKRSWRANDWMWGRLDAAERLVRLLDEACGNQLESSGRLDHHLRAVQSAVLRDLLPVVAAEIEADGAAGSFVAGEARELADAVRDAGTVDPANTSRVQLDGVGQHDLARLLELNRVGVERLAAEVGSPRASTLLLNAITTSTALLRDEAPRGLRTVVAGLSWATSAIWRWRQLSLGIRRVIVGSAAVVVLAAAAFVFALSSPEGSSVWLTAPAWAVIVVGGLVVLARAVLFALARRTRRRALTQAWRAPTPGLESTPLEERDPV